MTWQFQVGDCHKSKQLWQGVNEDRFLSCTEIKNLLQFVIIISASKIITVENILVQSPTGVETDPTLEASKTRLKAVYEGERAIWRLQMTKPSQILESL